jgi:signal transduction histidine kinase
MSASPQCSLRWHLVVRLVGLQAALLTLFMLATLVALWASGCLVNLEPEDNVVDTLAAAVGRDAQGGLVLNTTPELARLREATPSLWFTVRDTEGDVLSEGAVPAKFAGVGKALGEVGQARLGWRLGDPPRSGARMKRVETAAGSVQIMTGYGGQVPILSLIWAVLAISASVMIPVLVLMAAATLIATPIVVRQALEGLNAAAAEAELIEVSERGARLSLENVPAEVVPLVHAVNAALGRLDEGYERRQRFLMDAAHELRTPIAILTTRLEGLEDGTQKTRLVADAARLANLAEQLLDLQRVDQDRHSFVPVDLVNLGRQVAADLAPLAIAAGFELSFEADAEHLNVSGDPLSLERALTNLVQNAIEHAGRRGAITIRVERSGVVEVVDEGKGIPEEHRRQIFEPFQRLQPRDRGAGLGLTLVSEIVRLHRGSITVLDGPGGGARFRILLPMPQAGLMPG